MPYLKVATEKENEVLISYADYGEGRPVVLLHGWPLSHRMFEKQIMALTEAGYRVIAPDRRGFGDSYKPWGGYDYDSLTADVATLIDHLDLKDVSIVGFSMGGGEAVRYVAQHGHDRVRSIVLMSAVTPYLRQSDDNPDGAPGKIFDEMAEQMQADRPKFLDDFGKMFVNWKALGSNPISEQALQESWTIASSASPRAVMACAESFSQTDFRPDLEALKASGVPVLVMHGDADKTVPFEVSGQRAHEMLPDSQLVMIEGGSHGIGLTHPQEVNDALLKFLAA